MRIYIAFLADVRGSAPKVLQQSPNSPRSLGKLRDFDADLIQCEILHYLGRLPVPERPQVPPFIIGTPVDHLRNPVSENTINVLLVGTGLPKATRIISLKANAQ